MWHHHRGLIRPTHVGRETTNSSKRRKPMRKYYEKNLVRCMNAEHSHMARSGEKEIRANQMGDVAQSQLLKEAGSHGIGEAQHR